MVQVHERPTAAGDPGGSAPRPGAGDSRGGGSAQRTGSPARCSSRADRFYQNFRKTLRTPRQDFNIPSAERATREKRSHFLLKEKQPHYCRQDPTLSPECLTSAGAGGLLKLFFGPLCSHDLLSGLCSLQQFHEGCRLKMAEFACSWAGCSFEGHSDPNGLISMFTESVQVMSAFL